jgi:hypothetical protein
LRHWRRGTVSRIRGTDVNRLKEHEVHDLASRAERSACFSNDIQMLVAAWGREQHGDDARGCGADARSD